jgi:hypothetical protein
LLFVYFVVSPLMRQQQNFFPDTNTRTGRWRTNTKIIKTETLLHLNLRIFFFFFSVLLSSLGLSNSCVAHHWLVHYLSVYFIGSIIVCVCTHMCLFGFFFPFSLHSLLFLFSHPCTLEITLLLLQGRQYGITHSTRTVIIARAMIGRWKKTRKPLSPQ